MKREIIAPNVYLTQLPNEKFKQNRLTVSMIVPNDKDKATMYAILPQRQPPKQRKLRSEPP